MRCLLCCPPPRSHPSIAVSAGRGRWCRSHLRDGLIRVGLLTDWLRQVGELLDHLVLGESGYYSFADEKTSTDDEDAPPPLPPASSSPDKTETEASDREGQDS